MRFVDTLVPLFVASLCAAGLVAAIMFGKVAHLIEPGLGPLLAIVGAGGGLAYSLTARRLYRRPVA